MPKKVMVIALIAVCSLVGGFLLGNGLIHHAAQKKAQAQQYEEYEDDPVEEEPAKEKVSVVGNKYSANGVTYEFVDETKVIYTYSGETQVGRYQIGEKEITFYFNGAESNFDFLYTQDGIRVNGIDYPQKGN